MKMLAGYPQRKQLPPSGQNNEKWPALISCRRGRDQLKSNQIQPQKDVESEVVHSTGS